MTIYLKLSTQTIGHPRDDYPNKVFPDPLPISTQEAFGYAVVFPSPQPESATEFTAVLTSKGHWEQSWR